MYWSVKFRNQESVKLHESDNTRECNNYRALIVISSTIGPVIRFQTLTYTMAALPFGCRPLRRLSSSYSKQPIFGLTNEWLESSPSLG